MTASKLVYWQNFVVVTITHEKWLKQRHVKWLHTFSSHFNLTMRIIHSTQLTCTKNLTSTEIFIQVLPRNLNTQKSQGIHHVIKETMLLMILKGISEECVFRLMSELINAKKAPISFIYITCTQFLLLLLSSCMIIFKLVVLILTLDDLFFDQVKWAYFFILF